MVKSHNLNLEIGFIHFFCFFPFLLKTLHLSFGKTNVRETVRFTQMGHLVLDGNSLLTPDKSDS